MNFKGFISQTFCNKLSSFGWTALAVQIIFLIVFGTRVVYDTPTDARNNVVTNGPPIQNPDEYIYNYMKDVNVMMIVGFGFLMTFLKKYGFSSVGYNLMISSVIIQWAIIMNGSRTTQDFNGNLPVGVGAILNALFQLCSVLIAFGAVLGKCTPLQYLIMGLIQIPILVWNEYLGKDILKVVDSGDSIFVHGFGAYFGLGVSAVLRQKKHTENPKNGSRYNSDLFAMIGTLFLWIYWPSFNAGSADSTARPRGITNTILSLCAATVMTYVTTSFLSNLESGDEFGKFNMVYVQNSTIAGGVAIGSANLMMLQPVSALIIGAVAGFFSVVGYRYFTPMLNKIIHDTCGVHNLHGFPSLISAVASAVAASVASQSLYGDELYYIFPALSPTKDLAFNLIYISYTTDLDFARTQIAQGGFQILGWVHTFIIAIAGGLLTGVFLRFGLFFEKLDDEDFFDDEKFWELPEEKESIEA